MAIPALPVRPRAVAPGFSRQWRIRQNIGENAGGRVIALDQQQALTFFTRFALPSNQMPPAHQLFSRQNELLIRFGTTYLWVKRW